MEAVTVRRGERGSPTIMDDVVSALADVEAVAAIGANTSRMSVACGMFDGCRQEGVAIRRGDLEYACGVFDGCRLTVREIDA